MRLIGRQVPHWKNKAHVVVRPMSTFGRYWSDPICLPAAAACEADGIMFTACRYLPDRREREYYTEFDDLADVEVQFLATMMLVVGFDEGVVAPYPTSESFALDYAGRLDDPDFLRQIGSSLREAVPALRRVPTSPPIFANGDAPFEFHHVPLDVARFARVYDAVDVSDDLMIRGLHSLIKSKMVGVHLELAEEANYPLYVALDALFSLIRRRLMRMGNPNPSSVDAQSFVHNLFGEHQSGARFFEEYYDDRIRTMHPDDRFGIFRHAPISQSDYYSLFASVREVYRELVLLSKLRPPSANIP